MRLAALPRWAACAALVVTVAATGGCGRRGHPLPPGSRLPGPPTNVAIDGSGGRLALSWKEPRADQAGRPVTAVGGYVVQREAWPPGEAPCVGCPAVFQAVDRLDREERRARGEPDTRWQDTDTRSGWTYRYRVVALDRAMRAGTPSTPVQITWQDLPLALPEIAPGDGEALVRVAAPAWPARLEPLGFRVYSMEGALLVASAPGSAEATVPHLPNDAEAVLRVHLAARTEGGWFVESAPATVAVTPRDRTPPLPPGDLTALVTAAGVQLRWLPSGHEVYDRVIVLRRETGGAPVEIGAAAWPTNSYLDPIVRGGATYSYSAIAVDAQGNRSLPARQVSVKVP